MSKSITFIHAADIHLGAPFRGLRAVSEMWAKRLETAISEAFDRVVDEAISRHVDFVIIAGDIFDTSRPSYGDYVHFFDGMRKLDAAGIPSYLCTGNHDPFTSWQRDFDQLPPSAVMFDSRGPSFALYERDGEPLCLLGGRSYYNQTWPADVDIAEGITRESAIAALEGKNPRAAEAPFSIGVIHTGLNLDKTKAPADPAKLMATGVDYWACGHIHARQFVPSREKPRIVFPGNVQGRDILETGERGCCLVTLEEGRDARLEVIPTASVVWERLHVDVSECRTLADIESVAIRQMFLKNGHASCDEMVVRIFLEGATDLHGFLSQPNVLEDMRKRLNGKYPSFYCDALVNSTRAVRDREALVREGMFPSVVCRMSDVLKTDTDATISYIQSEFVKRGIAVQPDLRRRIEGYAEDAESLVLDLLSEETR